MLRLLSKLLGRPARLEHARGTARAHRPALEVLEDRTVPSTILWTNRGSYLSDSDHFNAVFGSRATAARAVVDAAIAAWQNVIANFNYSDGSNTFKLTLSVSPAWTTVNGATTFAQRVDANGKPYDGTTTIGAGTDGHGAGWYIDPTPTDSGEYRGDILDAFVGRATPGSAAANIADLFTLVSHELSTGLGITADPNAAFLKDPHHYLAPTGVTDPVFGIGKLYTFTAPDVRVLFTSNNYGFGGSDFGRPLHVALPGAAYTNAAGIAYTGTWDVNNSVYYFNRRYLPSLTDAVILKDVYGYTINLPQTFGTFYANLDRSSGQLLVRGLDASNDTITVGRAGGNVAVTVTIGSPPPGSASTGPLTSLFAPADVKSIVVQAGSGNDTINVQSTDSGVPVSVDGGDGNDTINIVPTSHDLTNLHGPLTVTGGAGTDTLVVNDQARAASTGSYTVRAGSVTAGGATLTYSGVEGLTLNTGRGGNSVGVEGTSAATTVNVNGVSGVTDSVQVANSAYRLDDLRGPLTVNAQGGWNFLYVQDLGSTVGQQLTLAGSTLTRSGSASITFAGFLALTVNAGSGDDTFTVTAVPTGTNVSLNGGQGTNTLAGPDTNNTWRLGGSGGTLDGTVTFLRMANLVGGAGNDLFVLSNGAGVTGSIDGGAGTDTLDYSAYTTGVAVNLSAGTATGIKGGIRRVERAVGGSGSNTILP
jgi:hypothetical protein